MQAARSRLWHNRQRFHQKEKLAATNVGVEMTEVKIANYALLTILLVIIATFSISLSTLNQNNKFEQTPTILSGYIN